jgi:hypothetical protein
MTADKEVVVVGSKAASILKNALPLRDELAESLKLPLRNRLDVIRANDILSSNAFLSRRVSEFLCTLVEDTRKVDNAAKVKRILAAGLFDRFTIPMWVVWSYKGVDKPTTEICGTIFDDANETFNPPEKVLETSYRLNMNAFSSFNTIYSEAWKLCLQRGYVDCEM